MSKHEQVLHELRRDLTRKIVAMAKEGTTHEAPGVMDVDVSFFLDPDLFAREHQKLFRETPLLACLSNDIAEPGSYQIFEDVGVPMVVMRGKDGQVRAFLNVCPHRGARVIRTDHGTASRFTCRFHGWTFDTTGAAVGVPNEPQFCDKIADRKHLVPCPAEERHGLVFVQATPGGTMNLDAHLGDFGGQLDTLGLNLATQILSDEVHSDANWKYTLDTYFENYHLPSLHRDTFANVFAHNLCLLETWGPHQRFTFPQRSIHDWMHKPEAEWDIDSLPAQHFLFPNAVITLGSVSKSGSLISIHRIFPHAVDKLTNKVTMYAPHGLKSPDHRAEIEKSFQAIMAAVRDEDYSVTSEAQRGLGTLPRGTKFPVGRQEIGTQNFHRNVARLVEADAPMADLQNLDGRVVIVSGAGGGGIGTACTRLIAGAGATVIAADCSQANLDAHLAPLIAEGLAITPVVADVLTPEGVDVVMERTRAAGGELYGLVTVVGGAPGPTWGPSTNISREDWRSLLALNFDSMFFMTQAVAAELKTHGRPGSLVSIASASGLNAAPFHIGYGVAKAAIRSVVQTMALELAPSGIRVNTVAAGTVASLVAQVAEDPARDRAAIPMGRRGRPEEIAGAVLFLLSDQSSYMTGQCLAVDGGSTLKWGLIGDDNVPRYVRDAWRDDLLRQLD